MLSQPRLDGWHARPASVQACHPALVPGLECFLQEEAAALPSLMGLATLGPIPGFCTFRRLGLVPRKLGYAHKSPWDHGDTHLRFWRGPAGLGLDLASVSDTQAILALLV